MKKRSKSVKLSRSQKSRKALIRSLTRALVEHGSIETTNAKARFLEKRIAKLINIAKKDTVHTRRRVYSLLGNDRKVSNALYELTKKNFMNKTGGFTKMVKLPLRRGDNAKIVRLEWVKKPEVKPKSPKTKGKSKEKRDKKDSKK